MLLWNKLNLGGRNVLPKKSSRNVVLYRNELNLSLIYIVFAMTGSILMLFSIASVTEFSFAHSSFPLMPNRVIPGAHVIDI